ncbi:helix-turn-helix domain-containing protein [Maliponia aquimaris]|nr:helix-turn-helix domain-containing protein [Maliponia aquimaris]
MTAKMLAQVLALDFANRDTGQCNPSRQTLADHMGVSEATVKRALADLISAGWLGKTGVTARKRTASYAFLSPGKVVAFGQRPQDNAGHKRPATAPGTRVKSAPNAGHICTAPYRGRNQVKNQSACPTASEQDCPVRQVFEIAPGSHRHVAWDGWLAAHGWPVLAELGDRVRQRKCAGWLMPSAMPPDDADSIGQQVAVRFLTWATTPQPKAARA